jgi:tRNA pseudouridine38-40 synthase
VERYFIDLSFKGTNYHGWQIQPNAITVQSILNEALSRVLKDKIETIGAGRTDSGVHAKNFIAHFETKKKYISNILALIHRLNSYLPDDILINNILRVKNTAHARFDAISRTYKYYISYKKDPFNKEFIYTLHKHLDINKLNEGSEILKNFKDFKAFCKMHKDIKSTICNIYYSKWEKKEDLYIYTIKADRFLRNMIRAIVGTLINLDLHKINIEDFKEIINSKTRIKAGMSVPATGLILTNIEYKDDIFLNLHNSNLFTNL